MFVSCTLVGTYEGLGSNNVSYYLITNKM